MSKKIKVTDLEKFTLEHIVRPYQSMLGYEKRLEKLPCELDKIPQLARDNPKWWAIVKDRISHIGFSFPSYIKHELVDMLIDTKGAIRK